ncbi:MAG: hypothetical protein HFI68_09040 [Lachnospiraceae bacterium]|nr:hypothetical protein [Lachnospiraceae bacterium]
MKNVKKGMLAILAAGLLFSITLGIGCGKAEVENISVKKPDALSEAEDASPTEEGQKKSGQGSAGESVGRKEKERGLMAENIPGETEKQKALREKYGIPEYVSEEKVTGENGVVKTIDAEVVVPDADSFLEVSAQKKSFGENEIGQYVKPLLGEGGLYRVEPEAYEYLVDMEQETKLRLENQYYDGEEDRRLLEETLQSDKQWLKETEKEVQKVEVPLQTEDYQKEEGGKSFKHLEGFTDWEQRTMRVNMSSAGMYFLPWPLMEQNSCTISMELAEDLAEDYMERMGLSGEFTLAYAKKQEFDYWSGLREGYAFHYMRELGGVPIVYSGLKFVIDDKGVAELRYRDYVIGNDGTPVELLPFSEIREIYRQSEIRIMCEPSKLESVSVEEIRLVYRWVQDFEGSGEGRLLPAWEAYGSYTEIDENGNRRTSNPAEGECLFAVNAVDGSILYGD